VPAGEFHASDESGEGNITESDDGSIAGSRTGTGISQGRNNDARWENGTFDRADSIELRKAGIKKRKEVLG